MLPNQAKRPMKVSKNRLEPADCDNVTRRSTLAIRLFLKVVLHLSRKILPAPDPDSGGDIPRENREKEE